MELGIAVGRKLGKLDGISEASGVGAAERVPVGNGVVVVGFDEIVGLSEGL